MPRGKNPGTLTGGAQLPGKRAPVIKTDRGPAVKAHIKTQPKAPRKKTHGAPRKDQSSNTGHFLPGNKIWLEKSSYGENPIFATSADLWAACCEYFEAVIEHPLYEAQAKSYEGDHDLVAIPKMRAMSIQALCVFLDISRNSWNKWRTAQPALAEAIDKVESVLWAQKFEGAAAGMLNANIVARDIGLVDKSEQNTQTTVVIKGKDADL